MTLTSGSRIKRKIALLTMFLFIAGTVAFFESTVSPGLADARHLFSILAASYLIAWGGYALISNVPRAEIRGQFVLMTIGVGIALAVAELPAWLRLIDYRQTFAVTSYVPWEQPNYLPDRELLALPRPNQVVKTAFTRGNIGRFACLPAHPAESYDVKYDKNGFRNDKDLSSAEIAVIGDSYVESLQLPSTSLLTAHLAELQQKTVANLGQSGFGPQQELIVLKRYALPLHPQLIIWMFYEGNDLADVQRYDMSLSVLSRAWDSLDRVWHRSFTKNLLTAAVQFSQGCEPSERMASNYGIVAGDDGREYRTYFMDHTISVTPTIQELDALKTTTATLKTAHDLAQDQGADLMVVFVPTKFRVYHDIATLNSDSTADIKWWVVNDLPERLRRLTADISPDIRFLDLTPALKAAARANRMVFIPDDTHWTADGHRVVAEALDSALKADGRRELDGRDDRPRMTDNQTIDISSDTMMVRNQDGTIRYWSEGAERMYGWDRQTALGAVSHRLLKTVFPVPLAVIEAELSTNRYWEGELIHERRDGSRVRVTSRWEFQQDAEAKDQSITVIEINKLSASDRISPPG